MFFLSLFLFKGEVSQFSILLYIYLISILVVLSLTVYNYYNIMIVANHAKHVISEEKSRDQDGLNQASVRSVCKTKASEYKINRNANPLAYAVNIDNS